MVAEQYRREAELIEQVAQRLSLQPEKEELLAEARSLRRLAATFDGAEQAIDGAAEGPDLPERDGGPAPHGSSPI